MPNYQLKENMVKIPAGWLIDISGWKKRGNSRVGVYQNQALVIINKGNALSEDVISFYKSIQEDVLNKFGIQIEPEVIML
jgi:UDP-N-acetylmuramate dehydrogenase